MSDKNFDAGMQFFNDMTRMASNAFGTMLGGQQDFEALIHQKVEQFAAAANLVTREEFEAVKEMAAKARKENEALKKELASLKDGKTSTVKAKAVIKKSTPKKVTVKKAATKKATTKKVAVKKAPAKKPTKKAAKK